jgi:hypothetical protein
MFSNRAGKDSDETKKADELIRCSSPRTIALSINQLEKGLSEALGVLFAQKQLLDNELYMLPLEEDQESDTDQVFENQSRREYLNSAIAKLETEMVNLRSVKIAEYIKLDGSIGTKHMADNEKMKKAALPYSKLKVSFSINHRFFISNVTKFLISIVLLNHTCIFRTFKPRLNLVSLVLIAS